LTPSSRTSSTLHTTASGARERVADVRTAPPRALLDPRSFVGRAPEQTRKFLEEWVKPALAEPELKAALAATQAVKAELSV
jgi:hypothetical protein